MRNLFFPQPYRVCQWGASAQNTPNPEYFRRLDGEITDFLDTLLNIQDLEKLNSKVFPRNCPNAEQIVVCLWKTCGKVWKSLGKPFGRLGKSWGKDVDYPVRKIFPSPPNFCEKFRAVRIHSYMYLACNSPIGVSIPYLPCGIRSGCER